MATVGRAEIHQAVLEGNVLALEAYLSNHSDCNIINDKLHNRTLLHCAAYAGSLDCTEALLRSKSIDLNRPDKFGLSPLQCAGLKNHLEIVKLLIKAKADVNQVDHDHSTVLHKVCREGFKDIVSELLEAPGILINIADSNGLTPLHIATERGHAAIIQILVRHGADPNKQDVDGQTPLHVATYHIHPKTVRYLLKKAANPELADVEGATPLHLACWIGNVELVEQLMEAITDPNIKDVDGCTALSLCAEQGNLLCVQAMLSNNMVDLRPDLMGETPIHKAALNNRGEVLQTLLKHFKKMNKDMTEHLKELREMRQKQESEMNGSIENEQQNQNEQQQQQNGQQKQQQNDQKQNNNTDNINSSSSSIKNTNNNWGVDFPDLRDATPLLGAAFNGHVQCVSLLLEFGADVNHQDEEGATALHKCSFNGHLDVLELLLIRRSDIDKPDASGATPLHKAAFNGQTEAIIMLCKVGAQVTALDHQGGTALHNAAYGGHVESVQALLRFMPNPASIAATDLEGFNALHMAASQGHDHVIQLLLTHRDSPFNIETPTLAGWTALILALKQQHRSTAILLARYGAKFNLTKELSRKLRNVPNSLLQEIKQEAQIYSSKSPSSTRKQSFAASQHLSFNSSSTASTSSSSYLQFNQRLMNFAAQQATSKRRKTDKPKGYETDTSNYPSTHPTVLSGSLSARDSTYDNNDGDTFTESSNPSSPRKSSRKDKRSSRKANSKQQDALPDHYASDFGDSRKSKRSSRREAKNSNNSYSNNNNSNSNDSIKNDDLFDSLSRIQESSPSIVPASSKKSRRTSQSADPSSRRRADTTIAQPSSDLLASGLNDLSLSSNTKHGRPHTGSLYISNRAPRAKVDIFDQPASRRNTSQSTSDLADLPFDELSSENANPHVGMAPSQSMPVLPAGVTSNVGNPTSPSTYEMSRRHPRKFKRQNDSPEILQAVDLFKKNPGDAIELLIESDILEDNCSVVARWMFDRDDLDRAQLGLFLSREKSWNSSILESFVELFNFSDMDFDMALRRYLSKFRLPGEAQKIDRLMEKFASRYFSQNPSLGVFADKDAVYVLAFGVIMLNTDAHNPAIKKANKMTRTQFVRNMTGVNGGQDFPEKFLADLYEKIVMYEIKMESDETEFTNAELKGYLLKQGGRVKSWKKRWFVLDGNCLFYFNSSTDKDPTGIIPLENLLVQAVHSKRRHTFELRNPNEGPIKATVRKNSQMVVGAHESYLFQAANDQEMHLWIDSINRNIFRNPFYLLLAAKRKQLETRVKSKTGNTSSSHSSKSKIKRSNESSLTLNANLKTSSKNTETGLTSIPESSNTMSEQDSLVPSSSTTPSPPSSVKNAVSPTKYGSGKNSSSTSSRKDMTSSPR